MNILMLAPASSVHTLRWANALAERGNEVHLVSQHAPVQGRPKVAAIHDLPHLGGAGYLLNGRRLRSILRGIRPDVVNAHYATGYGTLARSVRDVPVVLNVWGSDVYDFPHKSVVHRWWLKRNLLAATRLVATSEAMADRTQGIVPERPRPAVVPFGVDLERFHPVGRSSATNNVVVIGTVKSLAHVYGVDTLIKAFALVHERRPRGSVRLRIVGDGPDRANLQKLGDGLLPKDAVEFVGAVPHAAVPDELPKLDVFAAFSRQESFGVAVIEASACGLPVVVSDVGGLPEVVRDGVSGSVVPVDDLQLAAHKLEELVASAELRTRMGNAGRALVMERYEWSSCVDRMMKVLEEAAQLHRRP